MANTVHSRNYAADLAGINLVSGNKPDEIMPGKTPDEIKPDQGDTATPSVPDEIVPDDGDIDRPGKVIPETPMPPD